MKYINVLILQWPIYAISWLLSNHTWLVKPTGEHSISKSYLQYWIIQLHIKHYCGAMASDITDFSIVYSTVCSGAYQRKSKASRRWPLWGEPTGDWWFPSQRPVTRKMFPFGDVIRKASTNVVAWHIHIQHLTSYRVLPDRENWTNGDDVFISKMLPSQCK